MSDSHDEPAGPAAPSDPGHLDSGDRDNGGLSVLLNRHRPELYRFLVVRCGNPSDADDVMQDLWLKLANLRPGPIANGRAYLFRMANNLALDRSRTAMREAARQARWLENEQGAVEVEERIDPALPADAAIAAAQDRAILLRAVEALPQRARHALTLYRFEGLNQSDVAATMGISRSAVEKHLVVAMKHLRRAFAGWGEIDAAASSSSGEEKDETRHGRGS